MWLRFTLIFHCLAIALAAESPNLQEEFITITDDESDRVQASVKSILTSYQQWTKLASTTYYKRWDNDDDTVTIERPYFNFRGSSVYLPPGLEQVGCTLYGFGMHKFSDQNDRRSATTVALDAKGKMTSRPKAPAPTSTTKIISSLTCVWDGKEIKDRSCPIDISTKDGMRSLNTKNIEDAISSVIAKKNPNAKEVHLNDDGTITLDEPKFRYKGEARRISGTSTTGTCTLYGFTKYHFHLSAKERETGPVVELDQKAAMSGKPKDYPSTSTADVLSSITCSGLLGTPPI